MVVCECGCGQSMHERNWQNHPRRFIAGHQTRGINHPSYKSGSYITEYGYRVIFTRGHPRARKGYVFEHILVMEKHLGRYISRNEYIHHKDHNRLNNNIDNLVLCSSIKEHRGFHRGMYDIRCVECDSENIRGGELAIIINNVISYVVDCGETFSRYYLVV